MRKNQIKRIVNDLLDFEGYRNPISQIWLENKFELNLKTGEIKYAGEDDDVRKFYKNKRKWFLSRIRKLKGKIGDFEEAKIMVFGAEEKIVIKYKGKIIENEINYKRLK